MKKKIIIIIIIVAILGIASFFIYKKQKKASGASTGGSSGNSNLTTNQPSTFPLKNGSRGNEVKILQSTLNKTGQTAIPLVVDGIFGTKTEAALYEKVGLKQLTKNQYTAYVKISNNELASGLTLIQKDEIKHA